MASRSRKLKSIERRWRERFGGPPSLLTDPDLMLKILDASPPSPHGDESSVQPGRGLGLVGPGAAVDQPL